MTGERKTKLLYSNSQGKSGEIYSEVKDGKSRHFASVEISFEEAKYYLEHPEEFIKFASDAGISLPDEFLDAVAGGMGLQFDTHVFR